MTAMTHRVGYLGPAGTFSEEAVWRLARRAGAGGVEAVPLDSPGAVVAAVHAGDVDFGCLPVENSVNGAVTSTFDALAPSGGWRAQILAEVDLPIAFAIMTDGRPLPEVDSIATHPVGREQIAGWLERELPRADYVPAASNAAAARLVAEGSVHAAAAPERAAELFGLEVVARGVADRRDARTRFVAIGPPARPPRPSGADRTAVTFRLAHEPGSLWRALGEFAGRGVDLLRIESRPTKERMGTYRFHVDLSGHIDEERLGDALVALYPHTESLHFLGSWPRVEEPPADRIAAGAPEDGGRPAGRQRAGEAAEWLAAARAGR
ncbi:hypothetical protein HMPREF9719_01460 [Corynebacterium otitidis ATCC 51513]|uniref:Prephenate dehydratase n=3 Tax=Corynebacterium otitidis TaxID=29321 RepID=K0YQ47_9CORY|nr:hypothetical protein HMPREF9719_01460 [Corynebacterium otitidis ATCC 51513]